ncbi:zinc finger protein 407 [Antennarius striatus]|uniref:zinc finger protein 407 n=1 Tax=Antennarius striatus TaxID=241820 RepID=UPI0035AE5DE9
MDKTLLAGKEAVDDKVTENVSSENKQPDDVEMKGTKKGQPNRSEPDSIHGDKDNLCTICSFSAKCPRSLKIHYARKHGNNSNNTAKVVKPAEKSENISDRSPAETNEVSQEPDLQLKSGTSSNGMNTKSLIKNDPEIDKQDTGQEEAIQIQERRMSKRTPKPKMIHSCNYCGQEFRGKSPLDVHVQRYHTKDTAYTCDIDETVDIEEEPMDAGITLKTIPKRIAAKRTLSRFQLKCVHCEFRVSTLSVLENHTRAKHLDQEGYRCKLCDFYSATSQWMDVHLSSDRHTQQEKGEKSTELPSFQVYVESVNLASAGELASMDECAQVSVGGTVASLADGDQQVEEAGEPAKVGMVEENDLDEEPPKKKRGRPKQGSTTTCGYCGLVVSNATNLSVHVRRKHSKEYGFSCTLCNYNCVTKGDMDRHCITKKHVRRVQDCANKNLINISTRASTQDFTATQAQEPNTDIQMTEKEQEPVHIAPKQTQDQTQSDKNQSKSREDAANACCHCDFVAQSPPALHLHIKRKHIKDSEYVCLACSYYAVTGREITRHVNTEKHKQKSQKYLEPLGSEGQRALALPLQLKEVMDLVGPNSNPECDAPMILPMEESESCSDDGQVKGSQKRTSSVTTEPTGPVTSVVGSGDDKQGRSSSTEPEPTNKSTEPQQTTEQLKPDERVSLDEGTTVPSFCPDKQMSRAVPFDACVVSMKDLAEKEHALQEGLVIEGEASVICLTGGLPMPSSYSPSNTSYVKKFKGLKVKVREEAKGSSSRIRCEDCGFMADGISGLNVHISMKHPSKEKHFHCLVCGKSFYTESNLHQHLSSAAHLRNEQNSVEKLPEGGASFKCVKCTDRFESEQDLFIHIKEKHEELLREVNKYVLEDTEQINREREENQGSVCKYCGKVCKSSNSMAFLAHIRTHTGSKPFTCKICNFATAQLGDARNHVKRHLGMREYKCDICGWAFVMKKHLSTHLLGKHGIGQRKERKFECDLCERSFSEKWALNNHMKLHSGEKPYKCAWPSCHYAFLNLSAMKDHYRTHTGEKSYLCDMCGFAGGTRHALTKHRRQHTGERPFKCKLCSFASTTQSHLSRHKRVHTGEKPYRCPWCDYRSNCAENIRKHILHTGKHEGVKMYNCPKCIYATNSPMDFRNHLKEHHSDIENPDLAYLHAGIVSKSFECRLKGQGAAYVESETMESPMSKKSLSEASGHNESVQQVIIIQGYSDGEVAIDQALEESAAATLQTLAMAGQVAEVLHITEDGQVIASGREVASGGAHLAGGSTQYVVLESGESREGLQVARGAASGHIVSESSTALDALLSAVTEMGHQEEMQEEATVVQEVLTTEIAEAGLGRVLPDVKEEQEEVQVIQETDQQEMQEVLQLAASQMMKEGLTQVIVNDEGTHYIVTELDTCTLQVEEGVYGEARAGDGEVQQAEQQSGEGMVVYLDGANHNIVLEG